ncbi:MAG: hypothetical protein V3T31_07310 [candidate division Zixibacteria bacterium]
MNQSSWPIELKCQFGGLLAPFRRKRVELLEEGGGPLGDYTLSIETLELRIAPLGLSPGGQLRISF